MSGHFESTRKVEIAQKHKGKTCVNTRVGNPSRYAILRLINQKSSDLLFPL